jgi:hypothetical protein
VVAGARLVAMFGETSSARQKRLSHNTQGTVGPVVWAATKATRRRSIEFREISNGNSNSLRPARPIACFAPIARPNERTHEVILLFVVDRTCSTQRAYSGSSAAYELS